MLSLNELEESELQELERERRIQEDNYNNNVKKLAKYYIKEFQCKFLQYLEEFDLKNKDGKIIGTGLFHIGHTKQTNLFTIHIHIEGYVKKQVHSVRRIFSRVNPEYGTIEEYRQTIIGTGPDAQIRNLCLIRYPTYILCRVTTGTESNPIKKRIEIGLDREKLFIGEGAIILLYRQLALKNFSGELQTYTVDSNGKLVTSILTSGDSKPMIINGFRIETKSIERHIKREDDQREKYTDEVMTVLTRNAGFCILHEWIGRDLFLNVPAQWNPFTGKTLHGCSESENILDDMELRSKSRDLNAILKAEHREYIKDNPDIVNLIGDFLQVTLLEQPENVLEFAQDYFNVYAPIFKNQFENDEEIEVKRNLSWGASVRLDRQPYCPYDQCNIL